MAKTPDNIGFITKLSTSGWRGCPVALASNSSARLRVEQTLSRFSLSYEELADLLGVEPAARGRAGMFASDGMQGRLEDMLQILDRVRRWSRNDRDALEWYCSQTIPAFEDTAAGLVRKNHAKALNEYLDAIGVGGFA